MLTTIITIMLNLAPVNAPAKDATEAAIWLDAVAHDLPTVKDSAPVEDIGSDDDSPATSPCVEW